MAILDGKIVALDDRKPGGILSVENVRIHRKRWSVWFICPYCDTVVGILKRGQWVHMPFEFCHYCQGRMLWPENVGNIQLSLDWGIRRSSAGGGRK